MLRGNISHENLKFFNEEKVMQNVLLDLWILLVRRTSSVLVISLAFKTL